MITSKRLNKNYYVKVYGNGFNCLLGFRGCGLVIGFDFLEKFVDRLDKSGKDKCVCKLRRGLKVTIYVK